MDDRCYWLQPCHSSTVKDLINEFVENRPYNCSKHLCSDNTFFYRPHKNSFFQGMHMTQKLQDLVQSVLFDDKNNSCIVRLWSFRAKQKPGQMFCVRTLKQLWGSQLQKKSSNSSYFWAYFHQYAECSHSARTSLYQVFL